MKKSKGLNIGLDIAAGNLANMKYFETSAKTNLNVNETFTFLTRDILNTTDNKKPLGGTVEIKRST
jgi:hypothetical protein